MSGGGQQPVTTTTQTNTPWGPVAGGFEQTIPLAEQYQQTNTGYIPYSGPTMGAIDPTQQAGETAALGLAGQGPSPAISTGLDLANTVMGQQGITPGIQSALQGLGNAATDYNAIYNQAGTNYGQGQGMYTAGQVMGGEAANSYGLANNLYATAINSQNPYLNDILGQINSQVGSQFAGAGRYGSGNYAKAIAQGEAPALLSDYEQRQQQALNALGMENTSIGSGIGAIGAQGQGVGMENAALGIQQGAAQGLGNIASSQAGIYQTGLGQAGQFAQMTPTLQQAEYFPSQVQQQIGNYYTQRNQQDLNNQIALYNAQEAYPWEQLSRENAIIGGAGGLGGATVGTQQTQVPLAQRILGGGLAGAGLGSAFGPIGTGLGAAGGALAGGFL